MELNYFMDADRPLSIYIENKETKNNCVMKLNTNLEQKAEISENKLF